MDDQGANRNRGAMKQFVDDAKGQQQIGWVAWKYSWWPTIKSPRFLGCLLLVVVVAISIYLAIPAIQRARYELRNAVIRRSTIHPQPSDEANR